MRKERMDFHNATPPAARHARSAWPPPRVHSSRGASPWPSAQWSRDDPLANLNKKSYRHWCIHAYRVAYANGKDHCNAALLARILLYPRIFIETCNADLRLDLRLERNDGAPHAGRRNGERRATDTCTCTVSLSLSLSFCFSVSLLSNSSCLA